MITFAVIDKNDVYKNDLYIDDFGNLAVASNNVATLNVAKNVSQLRTGELQYNQQRGIPYLELIFSDVIDIDLWKYYLTQYLLEMNDITAVNIGNISVDGGKLKYEARITTTRGDELIL